jgi:hypothetical protein
VLSRVRSSTDCSQLNALQRWYQGMASWLFDAGFYVTTVLTTFTPTKLVKPGGRRRAAQSFPLHQRLRCCGHSLCFSVPGNVWRGGLAWRPTIFPSLRTVKRTALEHPALCARTPCSVHFQLPPGGAKLGTSLTGPVDSQSMPLMLPPLSELISFSTYPLASETYLCILCFR